MVDSKYPNENKNFMLSEEEKLINNAAIEAINEIRVWIEKVTYKTFKFPDSLQQSLFDGIILCSLINALKPGTIKRINKLPSVMSGYDIDYGNDNIAKFLQCCEEDFGLSKLVLFEPADLDPSANKDDGVVAVDKRSIRVLLCLYHLIECVQSDLLPDNHVKLNTKSFNVLLQSKDQFQLRKRQHPNDDSNNSNIEKIINANKKPNHLAEQAQETMSKTEVNKPSNTDDWQERLENWREKRRLASSVSQDNQTPSTHNGTTPIMTEDEREMIELKEKARKMKETRDFFNQIGNTDRHLSHSNSVFSQNSPQPQGSFFNRSSNNLETTNPSDQPQQPQLSIDEETMRMIEKLKRRKEREAEKWKPRPSLKKTPFDTDSDRSSDEEISRKPIRKATPGVRRTNAEPYKSTHSISSPKSSEIIKTTVNAPVTNTNTASNINNRYTASITNANTTAISSTVPSSSNVKSLNVRVVQQSLLDKDSLWGLTLGVVNDQVVVNKVKMGSCTDICDIRRGDVINSVNGISLSNHIKQGDESSILSVEKFLKNLVTSDSILFSLCRTIGDEDEDEDEFIESDYSDSIENNKEKLDHSQPDNDLKILKKGSLKTEPHEFEEQVVTKITEFKQLQAHPRHISEGDSLGSDYEYLNEAQMQPKHTPIISTRAPLFSPIESPCQDPIHESGRVISVQQKVALFESQQHNKHPTCAIKKPHAQQSNQYNQNQARITHTPWNSAVISKNFGIEDDHCDSMEDIQEINVPQSYLMSSANDIYTLQHSPDISINQSHNATVATQDSTPNYDNRDYTRTQSEKQPIPKTVSTTIDTLAKHQHSKKINQSNFVPIETTELDIDDSLLNVENSKTKNSITSTIQKYPDDDVTKYQDTSYESDEEETSDDVSALNETIMLTPGRYNKPLAPQNSKRPKSNLDRSSIEATCTDFNLESTEIILPSSQSEETIRKNSTTKAKNAAIQADLLSSRSYNHYNPPPIKKKPIRITNVTTSIETPTYRNQYPDEYLTRQPFIPPQFQRMEHSPNPDYSLQRSSSSSYSFNKSEKKNDAQPASDSDDDTNITYISDVDNYEKSVEIEVSLTSHLFPMKQKNLFNKEKNNSENIQGLPRDLDFEEDATLRTDPFRSDDFEENYTLSVHKDKDKFSQLFAEDTEAGKKQNAMSKSIPVNEDQNRTLSLSLTQSVPTHDTNKRRKNTEPIPSTRQHQSKLNTDDIFSTSTVPVPTQFATSAPQQRLSLSCSSSTTTGDLDTSSLSSAPISVSTLHIPEAPCTPTLASISRSITPIKPPPSPSTLLVTHAPLKTGTSADKENTQAQQVIMPHALQNRTQRSSHKRSVSFSDDPEQKLPEKTVDKLSNSAYDGVNKEPEITADRNLLNYSAPSPSTTPILIQDKRSMHKPIVLSQTSSRTQMKAFSIDRKDPNIKTNSTSSSSGGGVAYETPSNKAKAQETKCHICADSVGSEDLMVIEELQLHFHLRCFRCSVCDQLLCDGTSDTDVRVRRSKLHCLNCYRKKSKSKSIANTNSNVNNSTNQKPNKTIPKTHSNKHNDASNNNYHNSVTITTTNTSNQPSKYSQKIVSSAPVFAGANSNNNQHKSKGLLPNLTDTHFDNNNSSSAHSSPRTTSKNMKKSVKITPKFNENENINARTNPKKKRFPFNL